MYCIKVLSLKINILRLLEMLGNKIKSIDWSGIQYKSGGNLLLNNLTELGVINSRNNL